MPSRSPLLDIDRDLVAAYRQLPRACLQRLRDFMAARQGGSYTAAGRLLNRTPSAVSRSVAVLEDLLGAKLLEPGRAGLEPTQAADRLAERCQRIEDELALWLRRIESWRGPARRAAHDAPAFHADLHRLIAMALVVESGAVVTAGTLLGISQPAVSGAIRDLEIGLGTELFFRRPTGMIATPAALAGQTCARRIVTELAKAAEDFASLGGAPRGLVAIGGLAFARTALLPGVMCRVVAEEPGLTLRTFEGPIEMLIDGLRSGAIDLVVGAAPPRFSDPEIVVEPLAQDRLGFFVAAGHPLAGQPEVGLADLLRHPMIVPPRNSGTRAILDGIFATAGHPPPRGVIECSSASLIRKVLLISDAICFRSELEFSGAVDSDSVRRLNVSIASPSRTICLIRQRGSIPTPGVAVFLQRLREAVIPSQGFAHTG